MNNILNLTVAIATVAITGCSQLTPTTSTDYTQYVDQYIGTGEHGHVFMGVSTPFGAVQLGPSNYSQAWDWCSGYHWTDSAIVGFSMTHLSGTGIGDLGDVALMPVTGDIILSARGEDRDYSTNFYSQFNRNKEKPELGRYSVHLDRYDVDVELTSTARTGMHRYNFNTPSNSAAIVFDLANGLGWDAATEGLIKFENDSTISGYRFSKGWANDQRLFFYAQLSKPIASISTSEGSFINVGEEYRTERNIVKANLKDGNVKQVIVKMAISPVSIENAKQNMQSEVVGWDFDEIVNQNKLEWNNELSKIEVETKNLDDLKIFYTALYHTMIAPSIFNDINGDYRYADKTFNIKAQNDKRNYTTLSLWDTYRAAQPLMTIIHPEKVNEIVQTMLNIYTEQGFLPIWHLHGNETGCMVGNPAIPVVVDAYLKGFRDYDINLAYEAVKVSALQDHRDMDWYKKLGYIPCDTIVESVSKTLEYAMADGCVALMAQEMDNAEDYQLFSTRSQSYRHYFDPTTKFLRPKTADGKWKSPFDPARAVPGINDYTEGNAWQYTFMVPHDIQGLVDLFGSNEMLISKLDSLFTTETKLDKDAAIDVSGLIGLYAHGNEPSHHIAYIYGAIGQQWKTAEMVRRILKEMYTTEPDGLCGNEDTGQMSAWYVLSSMGIYQMHPGAGEFIIGSPIFDNVKINTGNNKFFQIKVNDNSIANKYIQKASLNGKEYTKSSIKHSDIVAGGILELWMGNTPNENFGKQ